MNSKLDVKNGFFNLIIKLFARSKKKQKNKDPKMKSKAAHNYVPSRQRKPDEKRKQNKKKKKINTFQQPHHELQHIL
jgi:hypothetical protein